MDKKFEKKCRHCPGGEQLKDPLFENEYFWVVCDFHPLAQGHILIIPKNHISCFGALEEKAFLNFVDIYEKTKKFINENYGQAVIFEHGIVGQTVFHAHMHFLPFNGLINDVIREKENLVKINSLHEIKKEFDKNGRYLFIEIANKKWLVNTGLAFPRFFRDKIAKALNVSEKADWKAAENDVNLINLFKEDIRVLKKKWKKES